MVNFFPTRMRIVLVGDVGVGKTCLLAFYLTNSFPSDYVPSVYDAVTWNVMVDGKNNYCYLLDTAGQEDYNRLRPLGYLETDVFMVCFSIASPSSYANVTKKWIPELVHHCPEASIVLLGTKIDLRDDPKTLSTLSEKNKKPITTEEGKKLQNDIKAARYLECSALTQKGVKNTFDETVRAVLQRAEQDRNRVAHSSRNCYLL